MLTNCPSCSAQYRLNEDKFAGKQVTLKCVKCQKVFAVHVPHPATASASINVLVAHSDPALCGAIQEILNKADIGSQTCFDGPSALDAMQARPPQVAIVDVALPGLYAFEVVERIRSVAGLEQVKIILLSSVYNKMAYKRRPASLYGADAYIEKHHLPDSLVATINRLLTGAEPAPVGDLETNREERVESEAQTPDQEIEERRFSTELNSEIQKAETEETSAAEACEMTQKAHRLARNIVSDIALYNQQKVEQGVQEGSFFELLDDEITEGQKLFRERFPDLVDSGGPDILQSEFESFIEKRRADISL
ncbi:MAG: histidine kinase [Desulfuromonas sp.]|nr:MAG: histidine kinase [Desulfuromonas sp.]